MIRQHSFCDRAGWPKAIQNCLAWFDGDCQTSVWFAHEHEIALACCQHVCGACSGFATACHRHHLPLNVCGQQGHGLFSCHRQTVFGPYYSVAVAACHHLVQTLLMFRQAGEGRSPPLLKA
jgi:hypothetical protein